MPITVLLVDDQELMRMGLNMVLEAHEDISVIGEAGDGAAAVAAAVALKPDVVLMDVRMPIVDGVKATEQILASGIESRVLVMTTFDLGRNTRSAPCVPEPAASFSRTPRPRTSCRLSAAWQPVTRLSPRR